MSARVYLLDEHPRRRPTLGQAKAGEVQAAPVLTYAATGAAAGMVAGPYGAAAGAILGAAFGVAQGLMGASKSYRTFAKRLAQTLERTSSAIALLTRRIQGATDEGQMIRAIADFKTNVRAYAGVGGFGVGTGPWDLPTPPGATGTKREAGLAVDFEPVMGQIREGIELKRKAFSPEGRAAAAAAAAEAARPRPALAGTLFGMPLWLWFAMSGVAFVASMFTGRRR